MPIRLVIADDHALIRAGLVKLLTELHNIDVIAEANDGEELLQLVEEHEPDLVLVDVQMPRLNGLESINRLAKQNPKLYTIMVSMYKNEEYILRALKSGAKGYVLKDSGPDELEQAIRTVMLGETYLDSRLAETVDDYRRKVEELSDPLDKLTSRQREVLQLLALGHSSKEMAEILKVSPKTIEAHRSQIMRTLELYDIASLVRFAVRTGLVSSET